MREAFERYVTLHGRRLVRTAFLLTGDWHTAEDLVQNTLAGLLLSWRRLRDVDDLDAYVHRSLLNARSKWWRRQRRDPVPWGELPDEAVTDGTAQQDDQELLLRGLRRLSRQQRAVVVLRYCEDRSEEDVARILGCSTGTVKTHASRGLARLRSELRDPADDRSAGGSRRPAPRGTEGAMPGAR